MRDGIVGEIVDLYLVVGIGFVLVGLEVVGEGVGVGVVFVDV